VLQTAPFPANVRGDRHIWQKFPLVLQLLRAGYEQVALVDYDAFVLSEDLSLTHFFDAAATADVVAGALNFPGYSLIGYTAPSKSRPMLNSGVVLFRGTAWSRAFLERLMHDQTCKTNAMVAEEVCLNNAVERDEEPSKIHVLPFGGLQCEPVFGYLLRKVSSVGVTEPQSDCWRARPLFYHALGTETLKASALAVASSVTARADSSQPPFHSVRDAVVAACSTGRMPNGEDRGNLCDVCATLGHQCPGYDTSTSGATLRVTRAFLDCFGSHRGWVVPDTNASSADSRSFGAWLHAATIAVGDAESGVAARVRSTVSYVKAPLSHSDATADYGLRLVPSAPAGQPEADDATPAALSGVNNAPLDKLRDDVHNILGVATAPSLLDVANTAGAGAVRLSGGAPSGSVVPRQIFTYWDTQPLPELVAGCVGLMRRHNPGYTVTVLSDGVPGLEPPPSGLDAPHRADWYRVQAVAEWGGVWLDATTIVLESLEAWWLNASSAALQGFAYPIFTTNATLSPPAKDDWLVGVGGGWMENWAFAAPARHALVLEWRDELARAAKLTTPVYCLKNAEQTDLATPGWWVGECDYFWVYGAFAISRRRVPNAPVTLRNSVAEGGPFSFGHDSTCFDFRGLTSSPASILFNATVRSSMANLGTGLAGLDHARCQHEMDEIFQRPQSSLGHMVKLTHFHRPFLRALDEYNSSSWLAAELRSAAHDVGASGSSADHIDGIWVR
jgi:hypothetical protein